MFFCLLCLCECVFECVCLDAGVVWGQKGVKSHKMSSWNVIFHSSFIQIFWVCGSVLRLNITEMLRQAVCHACCNGTLAQQNAFKGRNEKEWLLPFGLFSFREIEIEKLKNYTTVLVWIIKFYPRTPLVKLVFDGLMYSKQKKEVEKGKKRNLIIC